MLKFDETINLSTIITTILLIASIWKMHGDIMKKFGEFEVKLEALWKQYLENK